MAKKIPNKRHTGRSNHLGLAQTSLPHAGQGRHKHYQRTRNAQGARQRVRRKARRLEIENFFGLLKSVPLYLKNFNSADQIKTESADCLEDYGDRRIKANRKDLMSTIHGHQVLGSHHRSPIEVLRKVLSKAPKTHTPQEQLS